MNERANSIREDLKRDGYSKEEEYFYHVNQELIEKKKNDLREQRSEQQEIQQSQKESDFNQQSPHKSAA